MTAVAAADDRRRTTDLARLSPLVLLAVAMPWLLEWAIVESVVLFAPSYEPLVTEGLLDSVLYPVVTGTVVLVGLYALLDPATRRSLFLFRRPSRRELLAVAVAAPVGFLLAGLARFAVVAAFGVDAPTGPEMDGGMGSLLVFVVVGGVFAPLVEEVLFRGLLLGYLVERGVPTLAAAGIVVAAFGAVHHYAGPAGIAGAAVLGTILVALRLRYDNLVSPVLLHSASNLLSLAVIVLVY